jgi:hypothetical protein
MPTMIFGPDGSCRFIHDDSLASIAPGSLRIRRASHVEPTDDGKWTADLSPVSGPVLGPFETRGEALKEEVAWLKTHDVPVPTQS